MKAKYKFLIAILATFTVLCCILLGIFLYFAAQVLEDNPLPAHTYSVSQESLVSASQKLSEHYNKLVIPSENTETISLTPAEVESMLMLSSKYLTKDINRKLNSDKNHFALYCIDNIYYVQFSYFFKNFLPFGNYINLSASLDFSIKDHHTQLKVLTAKCGNLSIPLSVAQDQAESYLSKDSQGKKQVLQILKSMTWKNNMLVVTYYPKEILALIFKYQSMLNNTGNAVDIQNLNTNQK